MNIAKPVNIWTMHVDNYVRENFLKEVTSPMIYDPSSQVFHPQGLYSEEIFGQIGTSERISTLAYIDLHCTVLAPLIYLNIINVASWYKDLMESRVWAIWNKKEGAFEPVAKEAEGSRTGFSFFMEHVHECIYEKNSSKTRTQKIDTIYKAFDDGSAWLNKCIVCPAGWRDVKVDISGKMEVDEVNKLYNSVMIAGKEIRDVITTPEIAVFFDTAKIHLQLKVVEIFQYWKNFFEGKTGFGQARYSKRHLALGTRNVITSATLMSTSPADPTYMKHNDTNVPLFEALKMYEPKVIYQLNSLFYSPVFTLGTVTVQVIDPTTKESVNREVKGSTVTLALGSDYKHGLINSFEDESIRFNPVSILDKEEKPYWLYLVYDLGDEIYIGRSIQELEEQVGRAKSKVPENSGDEEYELSIGSDPKEDWKKATLDISKIRPLTIAEMLYIAVDSIPDKLCTVTRYPALCSGSIYPSYAKIMSTDPSRQVVWKGATELTEDRMFYHYPVIGNDTFLEGLIIHPSKTTGMNANYSLMLD